MKTYIVTYETRIRGAIGVFESRTVTVQADNEETARAAAREHLARAGYETRFPVSCVEPEPT